MYKATIRQNSDTWVGNNYGNNSSATLKSWGILMSTHPHYPDIPLVDNEIIFGRREDAQVQFDDPAVSFTHCRLWRSTGNNLSNFGAKKKQQQQQQQQQPEQDLAGISEENENQSEEQQDAKQPSNLNHNNNNNNNDDDDDEDSQAVWVEDLSTNGTFVSEHRLGKGNRTQINTGTEITFIPRGRNRKKVSFIFYQPKREVQEQAPEGQVTFVFTDVQSSTNLWEKSPDVMNEALKKHDKILRALLKKYRGYEVKTEGDAFMVVFFTILDAMMWCLAVQKELLRLYTPHDTSHRHSAPPLSPSSHATHHGLTDKLAGLQETKLELGSSGQPLFAGIRVRMGIHVGRPNCRRNPVTGRMDYFGPVVNRAARMANSAHGGQIVISQEIKQALDQIQGEADFKEKFEFAQEYQVQELGEYHYKGVPEPLNMYQIQTKDLAERVFPPLRGEDTPKSSGDKKNNHKRASAKLSRPPLELLAEEKAQEPEDEQ